MLPDFEMIQHQFLGGHDITIIPLADVHLGSAECMEMEFIKFIDTVKETPNTYLAVLGDLLDNGIKSSVSNTYKQVMSPSQAKREMINILKPVADRIIVILPGNHELRSKKESDCDITFDMACELGIENRYRENLAFLKIQLGKDGGHDEVAGRDRPTYTLVCLHGSGGGMTGAGVNRAEKFGNISGADALLLGHTHKPYTTQPGQIVIDTRNNIVSVRPYKIISATSWLKYGDYAARKMLMPSTHCLQTLILRGNKKEMVVTM